MPTSALEEVSNSPQISVKTVQSAGPMRCPQASFEAQPRIARLLAPKMGIGPYKELRRFPAVLQIVFHDRRFPRKTYCGGLTGSDVFVTIGSDLELIRSNG